ncbi:MAG: inorganic diphosphatase [bacterium]|nr:inorganic diphosphatase [bacterium]
MSFKQIPFGTLEEFNVVVEIPKGSELKYEYNEKIDALTLDWVFTDGFGFIYNYGFIPQTLCGDGDNFDVFLITPYPIAIGTVVKSRAVGMIELLDREEEDNKIIAVPIADPSLEKYQKLSDLDFDYKTEFTDFFNEISKQKNKTMKINGFHDKLIALDAIKQSRENYR